MILIVLEIRPGQHVWLEKQTLCRLTFEDSLIGFERELNIYFT